MKKVFQIAGGIVLAFLVILVMIGAATEYQMRQAAKEIVIYQKNQEIRNEKRRIERNKRNQAERTARLESEKKTAPVSQVNWTPPPMPDGSSNARQRYLKSQNNSEISIYTRPYNHAANTSEKIQKNKDILDQLIKKNRGYN